MREQDPRRAPRALGAEALSHSPLRYSITNRRAQHPASTGCPLDRQMGQVIVVGWSGGHHPPEGTTQWGDSKGGPVRLPFNSRLRAEFPGATVTSDAGLLLPRRPDERLDLEVLIERHLTDPRTGHNRQFSLPDRFRRSIYSRLAGYEDANDAGRLAKDPTFRMLASRGGHPAVHPPRDSRCRQLRESGARRPRALGLQPGQSATRTGPAAGHPDLAADELPATAPQDRRSPDPACPGLRPPTGRSHLTRPLFRRIVRRIERLAWHPTWPGEQSPRGARRAENWPGGGVSEARSHGQHAFAARGVSGAGARERPVTLIVTEQNGLVEREESMIHSAHPGTCRLLSAPRVQHQLILVSRGPARSRSMSRNQRTPHVCLRSIPSDEPMADCLPVAQGDRSSKRNNRR